MATNPYVNKVIVDGQAVIDLTADTATAGDVLTGKTFHDRTGAAVSGTCSYNADVTEDTATAGDVLTGKTFHAGDGTVKTGSMVNNGGTNYVIDDVSDELTIAAGYHDGSGKAKLDPTEAGKIIPGNIKDGVIILGVTGDYSGGEATAQAKSATPTFSQQVITPDTGFDYLSQVTIAAIPVTETDNPQGGKTVTVG
jgi:hypothetical protein